MGFARLLFHRENIENVKCRIMKVARANRYMLSETVCIFSSLNSLVDFKFLISSRVLFLIRY